VLPGPSFCLLLFSLLVLSRRKCGADESAEGC